MIVVDASVVVLGLLNDGDARAHLATDDLAVPHLVDSEVAHALRSQVLRSRVDARTAGTALDRWARMGARRYPTVGLLPRIWDLRANVSAYDATYVALAEALECPLVTADARLAGAPGPTCPTVIVRG